MLTMAPPGAHHAGPGKITNMAHRHAFTLVGTRHIFGVHMTQYHCEIHKYQLVMEFTLPKAVHARLNELQKAFPSDFFVLCNKANPTPHGAPGGSKKKQANEFSIPELVARRETFSADIFQGLPPMPPPDEQGEHYFPWNESVCIPAIPDVEVTIRRTVMFRPFAHHESLPPYATYLVFGRGDEAHMTNLQTAHLASGQFQPQAFGPDYDHVMSLKGSTKDWLEPAMLEAGIVMTAPDVPLVDAGSGAPTIPCNTPFKYNREFTLMYRAIGPSQTLTAGHSPLFCTAVCNSGSMIPCPPKEACHISPMPEDYIV
ncbi:MAG: hypothetical protein KJN93_06980 [Alphaproteobacteria bacterium]|nr:hypothetical protein [Alphaproteobacteria bacterium]NNF25273.1 hypothetical protein [Paracoccaceae bacterium]